MSSPESLSGQTSLTGPETTDSTLTPAVSSIASAPTDQVSEEDAVSSSSSSAPTDQAVVHPDSTPSLGDSEPQDLQEMSTASSDEAAAPEPPTSVEAEPATSPPSASVEPSFQEASVRDEEETKSAESGPKPITDGDEGLDMVLQDIHFEKSRHSRKREGWQRIRWVQCKSGRNGCAGRVPRLFPGWQRQQRERTRCRGKETKWSGRQRRRCSITQRLQ